ncbi:protein adenylyltransferase SelO isoform X1 [Ornithorhynchus anatinus]|uniref:Selenoprotein O n=1 Tax=Ornithorhynchus anatinus TaxID=9258 RepID=F6ZVT8_ORNAN|nr:protein adenylyltransferase SelO isoform X1 [Ornithorhynchus anatinus]XP_007665948.2 protein adenylyltransferase SelO isoform X1 [Ornithorhynchus anatinus]XP_007665949.2 protein adenylyltransferase SelO isoform X1 [Ornithorhynchus anatinus]XP_028933380.1 protein adenylyltransferase SelO isoform X1 [Ornithorhynchus anatinus]
MQERGGIMLPSYHLLWFICLLMFGLDPLVCALLESALDRGVNLKVRYVSKLNSSHGYCEKKMKMVSFDAWSLSTEKLGILPIDPIGENYVREVKHCIFSIVYPTPFQSRVHLAAVSKEVLEDILDLDVSISKTDDFIQLVSGGKIVSESIPLAHRYGGHQFGTWAGQLGDGRAHLIGIYTNRHGEQWELQLKGSGRTPYSRNGDGRAVLRSSVREFLGSEAMHYLGIPTSRAVSLVVSYDDVWRDQFYNGNRGKERGAVVLRIAKSWFRIGSLEILAHYGEKDLLRTLLDFVIQEHFTSVDVNDHNSYLDFFSAVVSETTSLIALWMSVGFAHGVCNTDNFSLLSITIDYGPFGFMESYDPNFVPNASDDERRYKIGNQASVGLFNLNKLLQVLNPLLDPGQKQLAVQILEKYPDLYNKRIKELFKAKLGFLGERKGDGYLIAFLLRLMEETKADFTMTFRQLSEITQEQLQELNIPQEFWALKDISEHKLFPDWVTMYLLRLKSNLDDSDAKRRKRMTSVNPRYVLKNWMAESAVRKAEMNDFSEVRFLHQVLQHPFQKQTAAEKAGYSSPSPFWAKDLRVSCSS